MSQIQDEIVIAAFLSLRKPEQSCAPLDMNMFFRGQALINGLEVNIDDEIAIDPLEKCPCDVHIKEMPCPRPGE